MQARLYLARNELQPVVIWARERDLLDRSPAEIFDPSNQNLAVNELFMVETLTLIRLLVAQGQTNQALAMLDNLEKLVEQKGLYRRIIEIFVLKALVFHKSGEITPALAAIEKALSLAELEGFQRIFLDEGEPMTRLLYLAVENKVSPVYSGILIRKLLEKSPKAINLPKNSNVDLIEALSDREMDVLRLLSEGLTNSEIAARLFITLSTVKGHTTNIYGKLSAKNRTQAVARARILGLLSPQPFNQP
jgi:LuxR family maltose regulon positive regulatory protein